LLNLLRDTSGLNLVSGHAIDKRSDLCVKLRQVMIQGHSVL
jgi:hypothetical protein